MAGEIDSKSGSSPGIPVKTKAQVEDELRGKVRGVPGKLVSGIFESEEAKAAMNNWMIGTHISWGVSLAFTFIGLNYLLITLQPPPWLVSATFLPAGFGYTAWQVLKWRRKRPVTTKSQTS